MSKSLEIRCPSCNQDTLLLREPVYEGFTKTGETLACSACGLVFASEEDVPFVHRSAASESFGLHTVDFLAGYCGWTAIP